MRIMEELPGLLSEKSVHRIGGRDLCELLGISPAKLTQLYQAGQAVRLGHDAYDLGETVRRYVEHLRGAASGRGGDEQVATLTAERARLAREQADQVAMKNAALRGELVPSAEVERTWSDILRQVRARILAVPSRLRQAHSLPGEIAEEMDRELRDALTELGNGNA